MTQSLSQLSQIYFIQIYERYKEYFMSNEESWKNKFEKLKQYIDENQKRPSNKDKNSEIKQLGGWISTQITNYKNKKDIMKNTNIFKEWTDFINNETYKHLLC
jgi:hypothetical protein